MRTRRAIAFTAAMAFALSACQTAAPVVSADDAYSLSTRLSGLIGRCWFGDGDTRLAAYHYSPERNADQSRILIVQKSDPTGLPSLVVEPRGKASADIYGPLLTTPDGARLKGDVDRWVRGGTGCST